MKRKLYRYGMDIDCGCNSIRQTKRCIQQYLYSVLSAIGLKRGYDYHVSTNSLFIRHIKNVVGRIMVSLRETFPVFNFYWETPRCLVWF